MKEEVLNELENIKVDNAEVLSTAQKMQELSSSSKLNLELEFLHYLRDLGRRAAEEWLAENFKKIGKESSLNLRAMFE